MRGLMLTRPFLPLLALGLCCALASTASCSGKVSDGGGDGGSTADTGGGGVESGPASEGGPLTEGGPVTEGGPHDTGAPDVSIGPIEAGPGCGGGPPASAVRQVSLSLTGADLGDATSVDWKSVGYNLDGKCTTVSSTDVCTLAPGAAKSTQVDGTSGIDNSYGENICPIWDTVLGPGKCSAALAYVVTDASGSGTLALQLGSGWVLLPITDAYVTTTGGAGMLGAVASTSGVIAALQNVAGGVSMALCNSSAFASIAQQIQQASDILADGSNPAGVACDAISLGLRFTGSSAFAGPLPTPVDTCGD
jgi:hypothetical protein